MTQNIDDIDMRVLDALRENSRATIRDISKKINMPITTVHNRFKKLKKEGVIKQFTIVPDYEKLDKGVLALVFASINHEKLVEGTKGIENLKKKLHGFKEIEKIYAVTGDIDLILLVRIANIKELDEFLIRRLRNIKGIQNTTTQIVLEED